MRGVYMVCIGVCHVGFSLSKCRIYLSYQCIAQITMNCREVLIIMILLSLAFSNLHAQTVHSIRGNDQDSCNVVNVHFNHGDGETDAPTSVKSGPPGKRGAVGPAGPKGLKGEKGIKGSRQPINMAALKVDVIATFGARSCSDLRDNHGISTTGYYWMRENALSSNIGVFKYCDFQTYPGVSTCAELTTKYNISIYGYYLLGNAAGGRFHYCPDVYTCYHLVQRDSISESGFYRVGSPGDEYTVYCNLFSGEAITEIWHDSMEKKKAADCERIGCYSHRPKYFISMDQIEKTINNSNRCQQFIEFECVGAVLLYNLSPIHGYWLSREGEQMQYWGGASSKRPGYCACGETGTCVVKEKKCNCDKNSPPITRDNGLLTDKTKLPVSEMRFADMGDSSESGWHTLGKLECIGEG